MKHNAVTQYAECGDEFYPTPAPLVEKMLEGIEWTMIHTILEPSAGKGDIAHHILSQTYEERYYMHEGYERLSIDCIEIDPHLRSVLSYNFSDQKANTYNEPIHKYDDIDYRHKTQEMREEVRKAEKERNICRCGAVRVVYDDFLKYKPFKTYDLIVMNPPFSNGCTHLLKALDMQKNGGSVVCLLNAETIRNPYTEQRKELKRLLDEYGASIEYIQNGFSQAERQTDVEVALIKVFIPHKVEESEFYERMKKAEEMDDDFGVNPSMELDVTDYIKSAVAHFNVEVRAGIELIRQFRAFQPYMQRTLNPEDKYDSGSILRLTDSYERGFDSVSINTYLQRTRLKYWYALLSNRKFTGKLTSKLQTEYQQKVERLKDYDFNEFNINVLSAEMMSQVKNGIEEAINTMFDRLTEEHTWHKEINKNRHYYDGWATNKAWKIDKKVIIPCYGVYSEWDGRPRVYEATKALEDLEKVLNYFDGHMTAEVDLENTIESCFKMGQTKSIPCKFFSATFYKKGTVHLVFTCPDLIERFNIYAAQNRGWLPPSYGKKTYKEMDESERHVVDTFQGEEKYAEVLQKAGYYLASPVSSETMLLLEGGNE